MTVSPAPQLLALVTHARTTPAAQRAAFAGAIDELIGPADRERPWASMLRLTTCHRVELYLGADGDSGDDPRLADRWRAARAALPAGGRQLGDREAASHLASVSVGLDSAVIAEDQVLHQLRASAAAADQAGQLRGPLARATQLALAAGRRARSYHTGPLRSLADRALSSMGAEPEERLPADRRDPILVVGAGDMGRRTAQVARRMGYPVAVASRDPGHAGALAEQVGGAAWPFDPGDQITTARGIVVALRGPWAIEAATADRLLAAAAPVVDLSFPSAVRPDLAARLGRRLITGDALAEPADEGDAQLLRRLRGLVVEAETAYEAWLERRPDARTARRLMERAETLRERALARLWQHSPALDPGEREQIALMTRQLAQDLLAAPLSQLGRDGDGSRAQAARDLFDL